MVTADPWAFLKHLASKEAKAEAARLGAYIDQAHDFFAAAENPRTGSKPLLYYYSFLNLVKVALRLQGVDLPAKPSHGISDPKVNARERLRLSGQLVRAVGPAHDQSEVFPEFCKTLGIDTSGGRDFKVVDLLAQVASVHRTYVRVSGSAPLLMPVLRTEAFNDGDTVWLRLALSNADEDVDKTLKRIKKRREFTRHLTPVRSKVDGEIWYETKPVAGKGRGVETALGKLGENLYEVPYGVKTRLSKQSAGLLGGPWSATPCGFFQTQVHGLGPHESTVRGWQ